jgi:hypothetical protein
VGEGYTRLFNKALVRMMMLSLVIENQTKPLMLFRGTGLAKRGNYIFPRRIRIRVILITIFFYFDGMKGNPVGERKLFFMIWSEEIRILI